VFLIVVIIISKIMQQCPTETIFMKSLGGIVMGENSTIQYNRAKTWQILLWPGNTSINSLMGILVMFSSYIAVGGYGLAVATAGLIASYTRIFDGVTDPLIAVITDRMDTKFGKIRIIMLTGFIIQILSVLTLFVWGIGQGLVFYTIMTLIYYIGSTLSGIATNTGNTVLTNDPEQRPKIYRWSLTYTTILASLLSFYNSTILFPKYGGITTELLQELCITFVVVSLVLQIIAFLAISEKDKPENFPKKASGKRINYKDAWSLLRNNRALQVLIISGSSDKLAQQAAGQAVISTIIFGIIIGHYEFYGMFKLMDVIPTLLVLFYVTHMAGKNGTKKSLIKWTIISMFTAVAMIIFMMTIDPKQISVATVPTVIFVILYVAFHATMIATAACTQALKPDITDYEFYKTGNYMPGTVAAVYAFLDKAISSFATTIVAVTIAAIGYVKVQPQPGDPSTPAVFWVGMFLWMGLPIIGYIFSLIALKWYPLDKEMMEEVQRSNQNFRSGPNLKLASNTSEEISG
jgi:glycoside/pentoside/hexuronide:cation symporter, GPH family